MTPETNGFFNFKKGTTIVIGNEAIVLSRDAMIYFAQADNEPFVAGMLANAGELERNASSLKFKYNSFGQPIIGEGQLEDKDDVDDFLRNLSDDDAAYFGLVQHRDELIAREKLAPEEKAEAEEAEIERRKSIEDSEAAEALRLEEEAKAKAQAEEDEKLRLEEEERKAEEEEKQREAEAKAKAENAKVKEEKPKTEPKKADKKATKKKDK